MGNEVNYRVKERFGFCNIKIFMINFYKTAQVGEAVPQLFRFLKFLLHDG